MNNYQANNDAITGFILIIIWVIIFFLPVIIATYKGRNFLGWLLYNIFLWPVALVHSLCLKNQRNKCQKCFQPIDGRAVVCPFCNTKITKVEQEHVVENNPK